MLLLNAIIFYTNIWYIILFVFIGKTIIKYSVECNGNPSTMKQPLVDAVNSTAILSFNKILRYWQLLGYRKKKVGAFK